MLQIVPTAFDAEDWLKTTNAKFIQLWMEVPGEGGYFDRKVQQVELDHPDGAWDKVEYPPFFWWRFNQIFGDSEEFLIITPDMMDEYFKEPEDPLTLRCPRCYSTKFIIGYPDIKCLNCGLEEPLIDFPISYDYHLALMQQFGEKSEGRKGMVNTSGGKRCPQEISTFHIN